MLVGLGHPRCGTGFTVSLLQNNGVDVHHEAVGPDGIVSWMQVARRATVPWGHTLTDYPAGSRLFLVARSPLAALNAVATENQQIRSVGFRSQVIWERRGIDIFGSENQTGKPAIYDFLGWAVMSLAYWYDICLDERPEVIYRVEQPGDDELLSDLVGTPVSRDGKDLWRNAYGPHKVSNRLEYPIEELARISGEHLARLVDVADRLGYPEDAKTLGAFR